ncbi:hypothetical protein GW866_03465 [bacterium]|nr:hypothetical protein [bacterium]OIO87090.1 MAG: hypothetical protein AUK02_05475 [Anaerolineae bacterium CG2_30_58_95]PIU90157.1 MAG: hypothetical protein COS63_03855 [Anaerolineae bacterium CG06_land_8_20_14_3_00_57_67]PIW19953.1 MAG: hypothetical protein COW33_03945 [Anaerolineae bacterium CG17_big_fil_post_rev_8_21_14_2_50_57_27]PJH75537.1 MAG: hypothetical protein CO064_06095 [Anaerolineae bacterium CG_4_9_14_0_8_um_filter_58_9]
MTTPAIHSIVKILEELPETRQRQAATHLQNYLAGAHTGRRKGKTGRQVLRFAGVISPTDLKQIQKAIEAGCEQVDSNEW